MVASRQCARKCDVSVKGNLLARKERQIGVEREVLVRRDRADATDPGMVYVQWH